MVLTYSVERCRYMFLRMHIPSRPLWRVCASRWVQLVLYLYQKHSWIESIRKSEAFSNHCHIKEHKLATDVNMGLTEYLEAFSMSSMCRRFEMDQLSVVRSVLLIRAHRIPDKTRLSSDAYSAGIADWSRQAEGYKDFFYYLQLYYLQLK